MNFELVKTVYAECPAALADCLPLGIGGWQSAGEFFTSLEKPAFAIAGTALFFYIAVAGFRWILSGGDKDAIGNARKMIIHSIIGFILLIFLFLIVEFLPRALGAAYYITGK